MNLKPSCQESEWEHLHLELQRLLSEFGSEDPFGGGNFWIVDDNYGTFQHKVCVMSLPFLSPELVSAVQAQLVRQFAGWEVLFSLDDPRLRPTQADLGVRVKATAIEELWCRARMRRAHGSAFRWPVSDAGWHLDH